MKYHLLIYWAHIPAFISCFKINISKGKVNYEHPPISPKGETAVLPLYVYHLTIKCEI